MTKELTVIPIPEQSARAERINDYHAGCLKAFGQQMGYAFLCGFELNRAKEELPHGSFIKWREANLPKLANGTAANYMRFCDALQTKFPTVGNFKPEHLQLINGELPKAQREEVLKAVHDVADGKTLTQLYRDLGVIRQPKKQQHTPPKKLSPAEEIAAQDAHANALFEDAIQAITLLFEDEAIWIRADDTIKRHFGGLCVKGADKARRQKSKKRST